MRLFHGSSSAITLEPNRCLYMTSNLDEAKEYALGLDELGNHNEESYIYALDIDDNNIIEIDDFMEFDAIGYTDYDNMPEIAHNAECGWYCIKHPANLILIEHNINTL